MENNSNELSRRSKKQNKTSKKKRRGCLWIFLILFVILFGLGVYVFAQLRKTTNTIHSDITEETIQHESRQEKEVDLKGDTPFSILLLGIDTGDMGRVDRGRSDTMMVATMNPATNKTTIVSIPRDTYTEIVGRGTTDKINHAYAFGGPAMAVNSVQNLLDIPIDYFVSVNMQGIQQIVDAIGGVQVTPTQTFNQSGYQFVVGQPVQMDGQMALAYSRMRSLDGDYARQGRQREVVVAILDKVASFDSITNYQSILQTTENNVLTNMQFNDMVDIFINYRGAAGNIEEIQMSGSGTMMDGVYYEIIPESEISRISQTLKEELEISDATTNEVEELN